MDKQIVIAVIIALVLTTSIIIYIVMGLEEPGAYKPLCKPPYHECPFLPYDVNFDFHINMEDYDDCMKHIGFKYPGQYDVDRDGNCTQTDADIILNYIRY